MIDEYNAARTGWARFSDDRTMRYRLARSLTDAPLQVVDGRIVAPRRIVFALINPSDADAFEPDPTVTNCCTFSRRWSGDVTEVCNLNAFRSPYPTDLKKRACGQRGDDPVNDAEILAACTGAHLVIAGWGNDGGLDFRDRKVLAMLREHGIQLHHLGLTQSGFPKHPLARGKHRIAADFVPQEWSPQ